MPPARILLQLSRAAYCMLIQYIIASGVTDEGQRSELRRWQAKPKIWTPV